MFLVNASLVMVLLSAFWLQERIVMKKEGTGFVGFFLFLCCLAYLYFSAQHSAHLTCGGLW